MKIHVSRPWWHANDNTGKPGTRFRRWGASKLGVPVRTIIRSHVVSQNRIWEHYKGVQEYKIRGQKPELLFGVLEWGANISEGSRLVHHEAARPRHWWLGLIFLVGLIDLALLLHFFSFKKAGSSQLQLWRETNMFCHDQLFQPKQTF